MFENDIFQFKNGSFTAKHEQNQKVHIFPLQIVFEGLRDGQRWRLIAYRFKRELKLLDVVSDNGG